MESYNPRQSNPFYGLLSPRTFGLHSFLGHLMLLFLIFSMNLQKNTRKRNKGKERKKKHYINHLGFTGPDLSRSNKSLRSSQYNWKYNTLDVISCKIHRSSLLMYENQRSMGSLKLQNHHSFLRQQGLRLSTCL